MYCLNLLSDDPFLNMAVDEYFLKNKTEEFVILGINNKSVIIGRNQVANKEVQTKYLYMNNIPLVRRISGGGTVFHDKGNLNFTFIRQSESGKQVDFKKYTEPVLRFLSSLGVDATFGGKNDLRFGEFKISGNAEHVFRNRVLHHGTLLFDTDIDILRRSIRNNTGNYTTRAVASNPSPVMNLKELIPSIKDAGELKEAMFICFLKYFPDASEYCLSDFDITAIELLAQSKYRTWEWNYANGPEYGFSGIVKINNTLSHFRLIVKDGIISDCDVTEFPDLAAQLINCRHKIEDISDVFKKQNVPVDYSEIFSLF